MSEIEDDLMRLAGDRVSNALMGVLQLADDPKVQFAIASGALASVAGMAAGALAKIDGSRKDMDLGELVHAVIDRAFSEEPRE